MNSLFQKIVIWMTMSYVLAQYGLLLNTIGFWFVMSLIVLSEYISTRSARQIGIQEGVWNTMSLSNEEFLRCKDKFNKIKASLNKD